MAFTTADAKHAAQLLKKYRDPLPQIAELYAALREAQEALDACVAELDKKEAQERPTTFELTQIAALALSDRARVDSVPEALSLAEHLFSNAKRIAKEATNDRARM